LLNYLLHQTLFICWENKFRVLLRPLQKRQNKRKKSNYEIALQKWSNEEKNRAVIIALSEKS